MSQALAAAIAFVVGVLVSASIGLDAKRDYIKAGYMVVDQKAYHITPVDR